MSVRGMRAGGPSRATHAHHQGFDPRDDRTNHASYGPKFRGYFQIFVSRPKSCLAPVLLIFGDPSVSCSCFVLFCFVLSRGPPCLWFLKVTHPPPPPVFWPVGEIFPPKMARK